jgi:ZIP family zinc transporter
MTTKPCRRVRPISAGSGAHQRARLGADRRGFERGGLGATAGGLAGGAVAFFAADWVLDHRGGRHRKRSGGQQEGGSAGAIVIGALMDGIPESVAIGVSLIGGGSVAAPVVVAVFLSLESDHLAHGVGEQHVGHC